MSVIEKLTERQRYAFEHPVERRDRQPNIGGSAQKRGKWHTILAVGNEPGRSWTWEASISRIRLGANRPYPLRQWKEEWAKEAVTILHELLEGVGGSEIDVLGGAHQQGVDVGRLTAFHLWRPLTTEEILAFEEVRKARLQ